MDIANSEDSSEFSMIKRSLNSILRDAENKEKIIEAIEARVICATRMRGLRLSLHAF